MNLSIYFMPVCHIVILHIFSLTSKYPFVVRPLTLTAKCYTWTWGDFVHRNPFYLPPLWDFCGILYLPYIKNYSSSNHMLLSCKPRWLKMWEVFVWLNHLFSETQFIYTVLLCVIFCYICNIKIILFSVKHYIQIVTFNKLHQTIKLNAISCM